MKIISRVWPIFFFCMFAAYTSLGQKSDFSGSWTIDEKISISGKDYANGVPKQISVVQNNDSISINRINLGPNNEEVISSTIVLLNGSPAISPINNSRRKVTSLNFNKENEFIETVTYFNANEQNPDRKVIYKWIMDNDGKNLVLIREDENFQNGEKWTMKGIYKKN